MKKGVIVIGAGGHAKVCIELLHAMGEKIDFCIGNHESTDFCLGVPVLKDDAYIKKMREEGYARLFVAIGSNPLREHLALSAQHQGYELINAISPQAVISPSAQLGVGLAIMAGVVINAEAVIDDLAIINTGATIDHDCRIGKTVHIAPQCALAGHVKVGRQSFLGAGCKVIPDIEIGEKVIVGAGTVIIAHLAHAVTAVGVPARIISYH